MQEIDHYSPSPSRPQPELVPQLLPRHRLQRALLPARPTRMVQAASHLPETHAGHRDAEDEGSVGQPLRRATGYARSTRWRDASCEFGGAAVAVVSKPRGQG